MLPKFRYLTLTPCLPHGERLFWDLAARDHAQDLRHAVHVHEHGAGLGVAQITEFLQSVEAERPTR